MSKSLPFQLNTQREVKSAKVERSVYAITLSYCDKEPYRTYAKAYKSFLKRLLVSNYPEFNVYFGKKKYQQIIGGILCALKSLLKSPSFEYVEYVVTFENGTTGERYGFRVYSQGVPALKIIVRPHKGEMDIVKSKYYNKFTMLTTELPTAPRSSRVTYPSSKPVSPPSSYRITTPLKNAYSSIARHVMNKLKR